MVKPNVAYLSYTYENRAVITLQFTTIFEAREATKTVLKIYRYFGIECRLWCYGENTGNGDYEVAFLFAPNTDADRMWQYLFINHPPALIGG